MRLSSSLDFDFQRPDPVRWRGYALLAAGAACLALGVMTWQNGEAEQVAARKPARAASPAPAANGAASLAAPQLQVVQRRLNLPWGRIMQALDTSLPEDVVLLSIEPDAEKARIQIGAEAKNHEGMTEFLRALNAGGVMRGALLVNHQIRSEDKDRPIRFSITAQWAMP